ncbi:MAG TPA: YncE family protein, partial [bacterium]|nr:YncE family protein [bacterium]
MSAPGRHGNVARRSCPPLALFLVSILMILGGNAHAAAPHSSAIDITPAEDEVWVVNPDHGSVGIITTTGYTFVTEVVVGAEPWCVDIHPSNGEAWVTSLAENKVYVVDVATRSVLTTIDVGFEPFGVAFNPSGTVALVTCSGSDELMVVDVATRTVTNTLDTYRRPRGICWQADGERAYVSHLLMPEFIGKLTRFFSSTTTTDEMFVFQNFGQTPAGYPSTMQNLTIAPAPYDNILWMPNQMINT